MQEQIKKTAQFSADLKIAEIQRWMQGVLYEVNDCSIRSSFAPFDKVHDSLSTTLCLNVYGFIRQIFHKSCQIKFCCLQQSGISVPNALDPAGDPDFCPAVRFHI